MYANPENHVIASGFCEAIGLPLPQSGFATVAEIASAAKSAASQ
jgi:hypothetical protein